MVGQLHHGKLKFQAPTSGNLQYVTDNGKFVLYPPTFTFQTDTTALTPAITSTSFICHLGGEGNPRDVIQVQL